MSYIETVIFALYGPDAEVRHHIMGNTCIVNRLTQEPLIQLDNEDIVNYAEALPEHDRILFGL